MTSQYFFFALDCKRILEEKMRLFLFLLVLCSIVFAPISKAQQHQSNNTEAVQIPSGHEAFFDEVFALLKKYPESAKRFGLTDRSHKVSSQSFRPIINPRTGCCGDWECSGGRECGCSDWCIK
jgi:hypothetical protein